MTIIVNPANAPPEATSAELHVGANGSLGIPFFPRRLGDPFLASDVDRDPLTIRIIQSPRHGTLIGTLPFVNYQPNSNFVGTDVLTYVANDGQVDSSVGTLTFIVLPLVSINNVSVIEGSFSAVGVATFSVTLSAPSTETVAVNWATRDGTAKASSDYTAASGTLFFLPGVQQQTIRVSTITDRLFEPDETFFVDLSHGSIRIVPVSLVLVSLHLAVFLGDTADVLS